MEGGEPDPSKVRLGRVGDMSGATNARCATVAVGRGLGMMKQHCSRPLRNGGQKSRDPLVSSLQCWLRLKPVSGGRVQDRFYNRRAGPQANCAVCQPERSNEYLTNRWHDGISEAVPGFRMLPRREALKSVFCQ